MGNQTSNELKNIFQFPKFNLKDTGKTIGLKENKIAIFSEELINIYDQITHEKIEEIKIEDEKEKIKNIIELNNQDLILHIRIDGEESKYIEKCIIKIYRAIKGKYDLFQTITDDKDNYKEKKYRIYCKICRKTYELSKIKKLSGDRFITLSTLGFKIYSYSPNDSRYIVNDIYQSRYDKDDIEDIYEVNDNEIIIIADYFNTVGIYGLFESSYYKVIIDKYYIGNKNIQNIWDKKFKDDSLEIGNYVILKNKYLIIKINERFYIFDIINGKKLIIYLPNLGGKNVGDIYNYKSVNDDIFISIKDNQIFLIQFNESWNSLKIIENYSIENVNKIENGNELYFYQNKEDNDIKSINFY